LLELFLRQASLHGGPAAGAERGKILNPKDLPRASDWAKPIVAAALKLHQLR